MLRRLSKALHTSVVLHRFALSAIALLGVVFVVSLLINASPWFGPDLAQPAPSSEPQPAASAGAAPAFTYDDEWTLLDLQRHLAAGDVLAISDVPDGGASAAAR